MSMDDKDEILANFQAITDDNDIGHCLSILEACHWNLEEAISMAITLKADEVPEPADIEHPPAPNEDVISVPIREDFSDIPSLSSIPIWSRNMDTSSDNIFELQPSRMLTFYIEFNDRMHSLECSDSCTILEFKQQLADILGEGRSANGVQIIQGPLLDQEDYVILSQLNLPQENTLLIDYEEPQPLPGARRFSSERPKRSSGSKRKPQGDDSRASTSKVSNVDTACQVQFNVRTQDKPDLIFLSTLSPNTTMSTLKQLVATRYNFAENTQHWGLVRSSSVYQSNPKPISLFSLVPNSNEVTLSDIMKSSGYAATKTVPLYISDMPFVSTSEGFSGTFKDNTTQCSSASCSTYLDKKSDCKRSTSPMTVDSDTEGSANFNQSSEDDEDMDYLSIETDDRDAFKRQTLIDPSEDNVEKCLEEFCRVFSSRYGANKSATSSTASFTTIPNFAVANLYDTVQNVLLTPAAVRKPLLLYLHRDDCITSHLFPSTVLCNPKFSQWLNDNQLLIWPWDLTHAQNRARFFTWTINLFDSRVSQGIKVYETNKYPLLVMLTKVQSAVKIAMVVEGQELVIDEVLARLAVAMNDFQDSMQVVLQEEKAMQERERIRLEQDQAYAESLLADQLMEANRQRLAEEIAMEKEKQEKDALNLARMRQMRIEAAQAEVPPEPSADSVPKTDLATIRFRLPAVEENQAKQVTRRFHAENTLKQLIAYLESQGYLKEEYKILTTFPRRNLNEDGNETLTLRDLKLVPQETIILEPV